MPIRNLWFNYKLESIEVFLTRAFNVDDEYIKALDHAETEWEYEHALDMVLAYQGIVFRAVYSELNALVELELKNLAKSILKDRGDELHPRNRGEARSIIEREYNINLEDLPKFGEVDEVRRIFNAYKHEDGFSKEYEEITPGGGWLFGYRETRYELSWEKVYQSIQAVKEFMQALPGDRQQFPETRNKVEDEAAIQARQLAWNYLSKSGALGHKLGASVPTTSRADAFTVSCQLCGKSFQHENRAILPLLALLDQCPGKPEDSAVIQ